MKTAQIKEALMVEYPYMCCANSIEFKQRLQWLSEGMLKNHLESVIHYKINQDEINLYKKYKGLV